MAESLSAAEHAAKSEAERREAFDRFMSNDSTKLLVSMVPPTAPRELLTTLLRSAFNAGNDAGTGDMAAMFVEAIIKGRPKSDDRL